MNQFYRIGLWNANGLVKHNQDLRLFISMNKIDILLISETHFTNLSYFKIPDFYCYFTNFPNDQAHGGSAILINNKIKHYELPKIQDYHIQATSVVIEEWSGNLTISAAYCPPRANITDLQFHDYFSCLGSRFISGGDFNAKHQMWGSRLNTPRGRQLYRTINADNLGTISTGEPTYWPTDRQKIPDLLDFFVTKNVSNNYITIDSCLDLNSDHSPVILTISSSLILREPPPNLCNSFTNWNLFREHLDQNINLNVSLKSAQDIEDAVEHFNYCVQTAAWTATPIFPVKPTSHVNYPIAIKQRLAEKRRLRRIWQNSRNPNDKRNLNRATQQLKRMLQHTKNQWFEEFTSSLSSFADTNYSLWKVTKSLKQPKLPIPPIQKVDGSWAKSSVEKSEVFLNHFENVFKPNLINGNNNDGILEYLNSPNQLSLPITSFRLPEVIDIIKKELKPNKAPGYDLITGRVLKELSNKGLMFLTAIFNAILRIEYLPSQWKVAQIVVVPKPGKPSHLASSYRPISLLPTASKVYEKLLLKRLNPLLDDLNIIPDHQFGFRQKYSTVEQVHRVTNVIRQNLEEGKYCSAAFLDVSQAFDKVWHEGLLFKIKLLLPHSYFNIFKSYLTNRTFQIKFQDVTSSLSEIHSGVPQGSVLGPILYTIFTHDLPMDPEVTTATFADDTVFLSSHQDSVVASYILQNHLNEISDWLQQWKIKVNESKSAHLTCTLKRETCPPVYLNNVQLPQVDHYKYLGMYIDRRLTWHCHIWNKRLQLNSKYRQLSWLFHKNSHLSLNNKLLIYKAILKPIWTYGIQIWGTTSNSNLNIIQRFQSKTLRRILDAPWYVNNNIIHNDCKITFVKEEITKFSSKYIKKLNNHPNHLVVNLLDNSNCITRLKRLNVLDLPDRF